MSKTFTNSGSVARGRGSHRGGFPRDATNTRQPLLGGIGRSRPIPGNSQVPRASQQLPGVTPIPRSTTQGLPFNSLPSSTRGGIGRSTGARGGSRMDRSGNPGTGRAFSNGDNAQGKPGGEQSELEGRGHYAGGYTVFSPNEKKRREINEKARKETEAYERHKQANAPKSFNYVGTVGGGEINQDQARVRQANQNRAQRFNRQMRQEEQRQQAKRSEEESVRAKREEARRKADLNAQRESRVAPREEVIRNREAFLSRLEAQGTSEYPTTDSGQPPSQAARTSLPSLSPHRHTHLRGGSHGNRNYNNGSNNVAKRSENTEQPAVKRNAENVIQNRPAVSSRVGNTNNGSEARGVSSSSQLVKLEVGGATGSSGNRASDASSGRAVRGDVSRSSETRVKQEVEGSSPGDGSTRLGGNDDAAAGGINDGEVGVSDELLSFLMSMFPEMDVEELQGILSEAGCLEGAIELLDSQG